jgi:short-subunit dehydrogenase
LFYLQALHAELGEVKTLFPWTTHLLTRSSATALALAAAGASIACLSRTASDLETLEAEVKQNFEIPTLFMVRDVVSDPAKIVSDVEAALGPIDILINNAGIARIGPLYLEKDIDIWWHVFEVNVKAPMALIHACLPSMLARGKGKIITLGSASADHSFPYQSSYASSKAALQKAHQCLAMEMRGKGIVFYCIHPGGTVGKIAEGDKINPEAMKLEELQSWMMNFTKTALTDTLSLAADSIVFLAADERMEVFSGKYLDCCQDMEDVFQNKDKILGEELNMLNIRRL